METLGLPHFDIARSVIHPFVLKDFAEPGIELWIKRDDLIHPVVSGNKWRKLSPYIAKAKSEGMDGIVTFGGAFSNHLLATAAACATLGLRSIGVVRGEADSDSFILALCKTYGMKLNYVSREQYRDKENLTTVFCADGYLAVPEGGAGERGESGFSNFWNEVTDKFDYLITAFGTGTTFNGLVKYKPIGLKTKIFAIPVLKGFNSAQVNDNEIIADYHFGGYGKFDYKIVSFIQKVASESGILLDPVYTAKCLLSIMELTKAQKINPGSSVLFLHTGGSFGLASNAYLSISQSLS